MLFVWITSYMFMVIVGGILTLSAVFLFINRYDPAVRAKIAAEKAEDDQSATILNYTNVDSA